LDRLAGLIWQGEIRGFFPGSNDVGGGHLGMISHVFRFAGKFIPVGKGNEGSNPGRCGGQRARGRCSRR
jgi:hypothetical protein